MPHQLCPAWGATVNSASTVRMRPVVTAEMMGRTGHGPPLHRAETRKRVHHDITTQSCACVAARAHAATTGQRKLNVFPRRPKGSRAHCCRGAADIDPASMALVMTGPSRG